MNEEYPRVQIKGTKRVEEVDLQDLLEVDEEQNLCSPFWGCLIGKRIFGGLQGRAVYLSPSCRWRIVKDDEGALCLIALKE